MNTTEEKLYLVGMALISAAIIFIAWGHDTPIFNFALVFGGVLLGHVLTEVLNEKEEG
jgi:hypothetical protein